MNNIMPTTDEVLMEIDNIMDKECDINELNKKININTDLAENTKNIQSVWQIKSHRKVIGKLIIVLKKCIRKSLKWYINPIVNQQNIYNNNILKLIKSSLVKEQRIDKLEEKFSNINTEFNNTYEMKQKVIELENKLVQLIQINQEKNQLIENLNQKIHSTNKCTEDLKIEVEKMKKNSIEKLQFSNDRLRRIERQINKNLKQTNKKEIDLNEVIKKDKEENFDIDYFLFEEKYRGSVEDIKNRQKKYLDIFKGKNNVLDIGCGRGEFVELLTEAQIPVTGIDLNEDFVFYCKDKGLNVEKYDLFEYLNSIDDNSIDGIYCSQVIEHLTSEQILKFIRLANKKLSINAPIVFETINPQNVVAVANWFYMDISHIRPVHPLTLEFILESEGFGKISTRYIHPDDSKKLPKLNLNNIENSNINEFNAKLNNVNEVLFGSQDYAIVAHKLYE